MSNGRNRNDHAQAAVSSAMTWGHGSPEQDNKILDFKERIQKSLDERIHQGLEHNVDLQKQNAELYKSVLGAQMLLKEAANLGYQVNEKVLKTVQEHLDKYYYEPIQQLKNAHAAEAWKVARGGLETLQKDVSSQAPGKKI